MAVQQQRQELGWIVHPQVRAGVGQQGEARRVRLGKGISAETAGEIKSKILGIAE